MDMKRIERIFFLVFLLLDLFLLSVYSEGMAETVKLNSSSSQGQNIKARLEKDHISYKGKFSVEKSTGYYLSGVQDDFSESLAKELPKLNAAVIPSLVADQNHMLSGKLSRETFFDQKKAAKEAAALLKGKDIPFARNYRYLAARSSFGKTNPVITCAQSYEGIPFFDDTASLTLQLKESDGRLSTSNYQMQRLSDVQPLREKQALISEEQAITTLYLNNRLPLNAKITQRNLGYSRILKVRERNVYVPVWSIEVEASGVNTTEMVNAINNSVITQSTVPKIED